MLERSIFAKNLRSGKVWIALEKLHAARKYRGTTHWGVWCNPSIQEHCECIVSWLSFARFLPRQHHEHAHDCPTHRRGKGSCDFNHAYATAAPHHTGWGEWKKLSDLFSLICTTTTKKCEACAPRALTSRIFVHWNHQVCSDGWCGDGCVCAVGGPLKNLSEEFYTHPHTKGSSPSSKLHHTHADTKHNRQVKHTSSSFIQTPSCLPLKMMGLALQSYNVKARSFYYLPSLHTHIWQILFPFRRRIILLEGRTKTRWQ